MSSSSILLPRPLPAADALKALREGNERFVRNVRSIDASHARRTALTEGQSPSAIILSCSDSRVPSEIVFDRGLGDLFVVRVAGNVSAPSLVGSVEYAAATFGTELVVVMGHSQCGAVKTTIDAIASKGGKGGELSENIRDIVERISPAVTDLVGRGLSREELLRQAIRANVRHTADQLRHGSPILERRIAEQKLVVVGAEYALETGAVDFFEVPAAMGISATRAA